MTSTVVGVLNRTVRIGICHLCMTAMLVVAGCGGPSAEELGEVHYKFPRIEGTETRYYLPPQLQAKSALDTGAPSVSPEAEPSTDATPAAEVPASQPAETEVKPEAEVPPAEAATEAPSAAPTQP